jgi:hypothetical protein
VSKPAVCGHTASRIASPDKVARDTDLDINEVQIAASTRWALGAGEDVFRRQPNRLASAPPPAESTRTAALHRLRILFPRRGAARESGRPHAQ